MFSNPIRSLTKSLWPASGTNSPLAQVGRLLIVWLPFLVLFWWRWRLFNPFTTIPAYGDSLEILWGISWFGDLLNPASPFSLVFPGIFHPEGLHVTAFGHSPGTFLILQPWSWLGGRVFALNAGNLFMLFLGYAGTYKFSRILKGSQFASILAALLYTFWDMHWGRIYGHYNILIGATLLPWLLWTLEQGFRDNSPRILRLNSWYLFSGLLWFLAISGSLYSLWLGGLIIGVWVLGRYLTKGIIGREAISALATAGLTGLLLSLPLAVLFLRSIRAANVPPRDLLALNHWGASLNSIAIPAVYHPWLGGLARAIYRGPIDESAVANVGLAAVITALASIPLIWRNKLWRPLLFLVMGSLVLALGISLRWDGESLRWPLLDPFNRAIWSLGHLTKPSVFPAAELPASMKGSIPMPGMILAALVPFWEGARTSARFMLVTGLGLFMMLSLGVDRLRPKWARLVLAVILVFEAMPIQVIGVPAPVTTHPAFEWVRENYPDGVGIVDVYAPQMNTLQLKVGGETLLATEFHGASTASGASSVWPAQATVLNNLLPALPNPLATSDLAYILQAYQVQLILFHMAGPHAEGVLDGTDGNKAIELVACFPPVEGPSAWPDPICILEVAPPDIGFTNLLLQNGWSGAEDWGIWVEGEQATARWLATAPGTKQLTFSIFPHCLPEKQQSMVIENNGIIVSEHHWSNCDPWDGQILLPEESVNEGWNDLVLNFDYATSPAELTAGENPDARKLAAGFTTLMISEAP